MVAPFAMIASDAASLIVIHCAISLPLTARHHQPAVVDAPRVRSPTPHDTDERTLLLVEDNLTNLRWSKRCSAADRHLPPPAMQGSLAIELAHEHRPDIIVLDLHLPACPDATCSNACAPTRAPATSPSCRQRRRITRPRATTTRGRRIAYLTTPLDPQQFLDVVAAALAQREAYSA